jgi:arylsulfatase
VRGAELPSGAPSWPEPPKPPAGAPNIVIILLDDVGFAATSVFGGEIQTPELQKLAARGLSYNNFHVVGVCSPTRAALLTGRNHHRVGFGATEYVNSYPGYTTIWPKETASIAEVLRQAGYSTAAFGKWHNTPVWEISPVGPFDRWPTGLGFEHFYGFLRGQGSQWEPELYLDTTAVEAPKKASEGYHFTTDITDHALSWLHTHQSLASEKPYFLYFAPAATHAPHHVPESWVRPYRGKFDEGWDRLRAATVARQKALGVIPRAAQPTPRPATVPAWDSFSPAQRKIAARQMEVFAGFLAHADHEVGRLIDAVTKGPHADNTLIIYITGDNGAVMVNPEGTENLLIAPTIEQRLERLDELGGPTLDNDYASGWGWATNAPFQWGKFKASHFGGTRNAMILVWPERLKDRGGMRGQFTHVVDIVPTILDVTGVPAPSSVNGTPQKSLDGVSMRYSFEDPSAKAPPRTQYFETFGSRGIYRDGWMASAPHATPWDTDRYSSDFSADRWELYHVAEDFSQSRDLASLYPEKLHELRQLFDAEAQKNDVFPLGGAFLPSGAAAPRPSLTDDRKTFVFYPDMPRLPRTAAPVFARSHRVSIELANPEGAAKGTLVSYGTRQNGFVLYATDQKWIYDNNYSGQGHDVIATSAPMPPGELTVVYEFTQQGEKYRMGRAVAVKGVGKLYINGKLAAQGNISHVRDYEARTWLSYGGLGIGRSYVSPVSEAEGASSPFTGVIERVTVELLD